MATELKNPLSQAIERLRDELAKAITIEDLTVDPLAETMPLTGKEDAARLLGDIRNNGRILEPILVSPLGVIDGRNRLRAFLQLRSEGVKVAAPELKAVSGTRQELANKVYSLNLARRHLTAEQKAMIAASMATATVGRKRQNSDDKLTMKEAGALVGVNRDYVSKAKKILSSGNEELIEAVKAGEATFASADKALSGGGESDDRHTPDDYLDAARRVMGSIDLDPASNEVAQQRVQAGTYHTKDNCGLAVEWHGNVWCNPPYSNPLCGQFVHKLIAEYQAGRVTQAILLVLNATDTEYFRAAETAAEMVFFPKRISFVLPDGTAANNNRQGSAIFYFGNNVDQFKREFEREFEVGSFMKSA